MFDENDTFDLLYNEISEDSELIELVSRIENGEIVKGVRIA